MRPCRPCTPLSAKWNAKGREWAALSGVAVNSSHFTSVYLKTRQRGFGHTLTFCTNIFLPFVTEEKR